MQSQNKNPRNLLSSSTTYLLVRANLVSKGTNFSQWCKANNVSRQYAAKVLTQEKGGRKALALKNRILSETIYSESAQ